MREQRGLFWLMALCTVVAIIGSVMMTTVPISLSYADSPPPLEWSHTYRADGSEWAGSVQQTSDGGYILVGSAYLGKPLGTENGNPDVLMIRTDAAGNEIWNKTYGGPATDGATNGFNQGGDHVIQSSDGGFVITGLTTNPLGPVNNPAAFDLWLFKTDANGNQVWNRSFGGPTNGDEGTCVRQTTDGGYIVTGYTSAFGAMWGYPNVYLVKTDANGNELWSTNFGTGRDDRGACVQQTADDGYIIAGYSADTQNYSDGDVLLIKTDSNGNELWTRTYGGSLREQGCYVIQTSDGGYLVTGATCSFGNGGWEGYLLRTDADGNEQWSKTFGGTSNDALLSIDPASDGGYIISGEIGSWGHGGADAWLLKIDSSGNMLWQEAFGGGSYDRAECVKQTADGGYIAAGIIGGLSLGDFYLVKVNPDDPAATTTAPAAEWEKTYRADGSEWAGSVQQTSDGGYIIAGGAVLGKQFSSEGSNSDVLMIKTDSYGKELWNKTYGGPDPDGAMNGFNQGGDHVIEASDGGYVVVGLTWHPGISPAAGGNGFDLWLFKTDSNGNQVWNKSFGAPTNGEEGTCVRQTADGGYIVTGYTGGFGAPYNYPNVYLVKTDANGNELWNKNFGTEVAGEGARDDRGACVQQTADGGYIIAGFTADPSVYDDGDMLVIKTDANGNEIWEKTFGGSLREQGSYVIQTADGGYLISGGTLSFGSGGWDGYIVKTDADGNELWNRAFGGTSHDGLTSIDTTSDGGYILSGEVDSWGHGSGDAWLLNIDVNGNMVWQEAFGGGSYDRAECVKQTADGGYIAAGLYGGISLGDFYLIKVGPPSPITFPDPALEQAIREAINNPSGDIYETDLKVLTYLNASQRGIMDLTGLEYCVNLDYLDLSVNQISNISQLSALTNLGAQLSLGNNQLSDISSLSTLASLRCLDISYNQISDISTVFNLTNLIRLCAWHNQISDISPVANLVKLTDLHLWGNNISDISPISNLTHIGLLTLGGNRISDISPLINLSDLIALDFSSNQISDISVLSHLTDLTELTAYNNQIADISSLSDLNKLTVLRLWTNNINDLSPLAHLTNLSRLIFDNNDISDIEPLVNNPGIASGDIVRLTQNPLSETSIYSHIPTLQDRGAEVYYDVPTTPTPTPTPSEEIVTFPDPILELVIRDAIGKPSGDIYQSDLDTLTSLSSSNSYISDLTGIEHCTSLTFLSFGGNNISNISALSGLTRLQYLYLWHNPISDISALSGLTSLQTLTLCYNTISDIPKLSDLTKLQSLDLSGNDINDIRNLSGLTNLSALILGDNNISDISALSSLTNLNHLQIHNNQVCNISALSDLTNLQYLNLWGNKISNISPLESLTLLDGLGLDGNQISNISALANLRNLTGLSLSNNQISDISALSALTNLHDLYLFNNNICDIHPLVANLGINLSDFVSLTGNPLSTTSVYTYIPELQARGVTVYYDVPVPTPTPSPTPNNEPITFPDPALEQAIRDAIGKPSGDIYQSDLDGLTYLYAINLSIVDLTGIEHCNNLQILDLDDNRINSIAVLANLTNLYGLNLNSNQISDISALAGLSNLSSLGLSYNQINNISAAAELHNLETLYLNDNQIANISPLTNLSDLGALSLSNNQISDISALANHTSLGWLQLDSNQISDISALSSNTPMIQLSLGRNQINDITPLAGMNRLADLNLASNRITDISAISGMLRVSKLHLENNSISDLSPLAERTALSQLYIDNNQIIDLSALTGLNNLQELSLIGNQIREISALVDNAGLASEDSIHLESNPLSLTSINIDIPALQARGAIVYYDVPALSPVADAGGPYTGDEGLAITLNGSGSYDPDGIIISYEWDLNGDGDFSDAAGAVAQNTWIDDYSGNVSLMVTDDSGATSIATTTATVNNVPPAVEGGLDQMGYQWEQVVFEGTLNDPGADSHTITWDFGDGFTAAGSLSATHVYNSTGTYIATLTVLDDDGGIGTDSLSLTVETRWIEVTFDATDQSGQHLDDSVVWGTGAPPIDPVNHHGAYAPAIVTLANGATKVVRADWAGYTSPDVTLTIFKDTTYWINASTSDVTLESTPGINKVNIVFEPISVTFDATDQSGQHLDDSVVWGTGAPPIDPVNHHGAYAPAIVTLANGATKVVRADWAGYTSPDVTLTIFKNTTLWINGSTGVVTTESTPGITSVNFVFELTMLSAIIEPDIAYEGTVLTVTGNANRALSYEYDWVVNNVSISQNGTTLDGSFFNKSDMVYCNIRASYGPAKSYWLQSNTVTIRNSIPVMTNSLIEPESAYETTILAAICDGNDMDNDTLTYEYEWFGNNISTGQTGTTLDGTFFNKGDEIYCNIRACDGDVLSDWLQSNTITIQNTAPASQIDSVQQPNPYFILPEVHTLTFNGSLSDPDPSDTHTALWDFGDGLNISFPTNGNLTTAQHAFAQQGNYTVTLTVVDSEGASSIPTCINIIVESADQTITTIQDEIEELPPDVFVNNAEQRTNALLQKFDEVTALIDAQQYQQAIDKLLNDIRKKADGSLGGNHSNDWVTDPEAQQQICQMIDDLVAYIETLM